MIIRVSLFLSIMLILGCAATSIPSDSGGTGRGEVVIATDATFPPFHYVDDSGNVTGFDIELSRELARRSGLLPKVIVLPYDRLFEDLLANRHHVVAATTGITPQREETYLFTSPYFNTCQAALVRNGDAEPQTIADLTGLRVGASGAGTSVAALSQIPGAIQVLLSEREGDEDAVQKDGRVPTLERGEVDALVVDEFVAVEAAIESGGRLRVLPDAVALEQYGFVLSPSGSNLKRKFDDALDDMRKDGSLAALQSKFGLGRGDSWPIKLP